MTTATRKQGREMKDPCYELTKLILATLSAERRQVRAELKWVRDEGGVTRRDVEDADMKAREAATTMWDFLYREIRPRLTDTETDAAVLATH